MQRTRPLQDHPELSILRHPGVVEYRVENWRIARDGSGRVLRGYGWSWVDVLVPVLTAVLWKKVRDMCCTLNTITTHLVQIASSNYHVAAFVLTLALYVYFKCTQVLWGERTLCPDLGLYSNFTLRIRTGDTLLWNTARDAQGAP